MSKYGDRGFRVGDFWLSRRGNSPAWCRTWYDPESGQVRRVSLDTVDELEARDRLTAWFVAQQAGQQPASNPRLLSEILLAYHEARGQHTCKPDNVTTSGRYWLEHLGDIPAETAAEVESRR